MKRKNLRPAVFVLMLFFAAGCASSYDRPAEPGLTAVAPLSTDLRETPDPDNVIHTLQVENAKIVASSRTEVPKDAFSFQAFDRRKDEKAPEPRPPEKIHPLLEKWIGSSSRSNTVEAVVVNFRDNLRSPALSGACRSTSHATPQRTSGCRHATPRSSRVFAQSAPTDYAGIGQRLRSAGLGDRTVLARSRGRGEDSAWLRAPAGEA